MYGITKHAVIAFGETIREELKRYHKKHNILVSTLVPGFVDTNIGQTSANEFNLQKEWNIRWNKIKQLWRATQMNPDEVANIVFEVGIKNKKCVIPTHLDWHETAIKDRMEALLLCEHDKRIRMTQATKARMAKYKQSKL